MCEGSRELASVELARVGQSLDNVRQALNIKVLWVAQSHWAGIFHVLIYFHECYHGDPISFNTTRLLPLLRPELLLPRNAIHVSHFGLMLNLARCNLAIKQCIFCFIF